jgi:glycosyltransferase involved in cell wall biosynthesis
LVELGHEVDVLCLERSAIAHRDKGYHVVPVRPKWTLYEDYPVVAFSMAAFGLLLSRHKERPYDVSHAMNFNNFGLTFWRKAMRAAGLAHVSTGFETTEMELSAKWREFGSRPSLHNLAQIVMEGFLAPWQRSYIGWADAMTTEDVETLENFKKKGLDTSRFHLIPSGIDLEETLALMDRYHGASQALPCGERASWPKGKRVLLCPGRVDPRKGSQYLLRAFAELKPLHSEWSLVFAGGGRGSYLDMMLSLVDELGLGPEQVTFLGRVDDLLACILSCDAVAIPSLSEGIPITLQEALVCGKLVWCSKLEGTYHWAKGLSSIRWCEPAAVWDWVEQLSELADYRKEDNTVAIEQGQKWMEEYDWLEVAKRYVEVYEKACDHLAVST